MFVIAAGSTQVSLTMPDQLDAGHVEFARQLASQAWAYTVAVERQYRNLPPLPETPVPYTLTAEGGALLDAGPERADLVPLPGGQGGDGMTATCASVRFGVNGVTEVESFVRLTGRTFIHCCIYDDIAPILTVKDAHVDISITVPGRDEVTADDVTFGRLLAEAVGQYVAELERRVPPGRADVTATGDGAGQAA